MADGNRARRPLTRSPGCLKQRRAGKSAWPATVATHYPPLPTFTHDRSTYEKAPTYPRHHPGPACFCPRRRHTGRQRHRRRANPKRHGARLYPPRHPDLQGHSVCHCCPLHAAAKSGELAGRKTGPDLWRRLPAGADGRALFLLCRPRNAGKRTMPEPEHLGAEEKRRRQTGGHGVDSRRRFPIRRIQRLAQL